MSDVSLPPEVLDIILSHLPVKSLLRFRFVSKPLRALIDSPYFVNLHLQESMKTDKILAFLGGFGSSISLCSLNMDSHPPAVKLKAPFDTTSFPHVLGSCHGLVCLCSGLDERLILFWNPSTGKHKLIPRPINEPHDDEDVLIYDQVGYDHVNDDYKVVRLSQYGDPAVNFTVIVYSLKLNMWQSVEQDIPCNITPVSCTGQGLFVSGAVHWLLNQKPYPDMDYLIFAFDLASQSFHSVPQPQYRDNYVTVDLRILGGCLCLVGNREMFSVDVWVMGEYGVKESWSKLVALTMTDAMTWAYPSVKPITYLKNGKEVLLEINQKWLMIYDLEDKEPKEIWLGDDSRMVTFVYQESLV